MYRGLLGRRCRSGRRRHSARFMRRSDVGEILSPSLFLSPVVGRCFVAEVLARVPEPQVDAERGGVDVRHRAAVVTEPAHPELVGPVGALAGRAAGVATVA